MDSSNSSFGSVPPPPAPPAAVVTHEKRSSHVMTGVILIVVGLIFLVDRMGWQWGWPWAAHLTFSRLWPLILIVAGIGTALTDRVQEVITTVDADGRPRTETRPIGARKVGDGAFLVVVGVLMLLHMNRVLLLSQSWPLFIVVAGLGILFGRGRSRGRRARREGR